MTYATFTAAAGNGADSAACTSAVVLGQADRAAVDQITEHRRMLVSDQAQVTEEPGTRLLTPRRPGSAGPRHDRDGMARPQIC